MLVGMLAPMLNGMELLRGSVLCLARHLELDMAS